MTISRAKPKSLERRRMAVRRVIVRVLFIFTNNIY